MSKENACGSRIRLIRKTLKEKQIDFAKRLGISSASLSEIESGKYKPNYDFLVSIAREYGVNIYYLLFGEGKMFTDSTINHLRRARETAVNVEEVRRFLWYFERSPLVQYFILGHFRAILSKEQVSIDKEVEEYSKKKSK